MFQSLSKSKNMNNSETETSPAQVAEAMTALEELKEGMEAFVCVFKRKNTKLLNVSSKL